MERPGQFILTLGNAGGVKAELNGKPQKPFGPRGKVAPRYRHQALTALQHPTSSRSTFSSTHLAAIPNPHYS